MQSPRRLDTHTPADQSRPAASCHVRDSRTTHTLCTAPAPTCMGPLCQCFVCADADAALCRPALPPAPPSARVHAIAHACADGDLQPARQARRASIESRAQAHRCEDVGRRDYAGVLVDTSAVRCCVCALLRRSRCRPGRASCDLCLCARSHSREPLSPSRGEGCLRPSGASSLLRVLATCGLLPPHRVCCT